MPPFTLFFCLSFHSNEDAYSGGAEGHISLSSAPLKTQLSAPGGTQITNSDIFIICTIETLVHYSKHFLYTEKMVRPKAQNGSSIIAAQHFFNFIHILFFVKTVS